ncbi:MAG: hypothetical protein RL139_841 [Gemmatimonadota bacterium]|jgi:omega-amidase
MSGSAPGSAVAPLRVALVQADTVWHDPEANRARLAAAVGAAPGCDLYVLPETFTSGFSNEALASAETMAGPTVAWMRAQSAALDAAVTGSVQLRDGDAVFNRLLWVTPDGTVRHYDKRHLFRMSGEHERYAAGRDRLVVEWRGWRVLPLVCYDLRFPVFSRNTRESVPADGGNTGRLAYDLVLYVANWPATRQVAWRTLLRARAIENLAYAVGVNRTGVDGQGLAFIGGSAACDPVGETLCELGEETGTAVVTLDHAALTAHRARFPAHQDADGFTLTA